MHGTSEDENEKSTWERKGGQIDLLSSSSVCLARQVGGGEVSGIRRMVESDCFII